MTSSLTPNIAPDSSADVVGYTSSAVISTPPYLTEDERIALGEIKRGVSALVGDRLKLFSLFGSKARGDFDPESDVDVAIVVDGLDRELKRQIIDLVVDTEVSRLVVISSLVLSWKIFVDLRNRERRIALDIEQEGIPF